MGRSRCTSEKENCSGKAPRKSAVPVKLPAVGGDVPTPLAIPEVKTPRKSILPAKQPQSLLEDVTKQMGNLAVFDEKQTISWLKGLLQELGMIARKYLPDEVDDSRERRQQAADLVKDEVPDVNIVNVDLYKRLFATMESFRSIRNGEGELLVAKVFDAILKIPVKRIHNSILKTHFSSLLSSLCVLYPCLRGIRNRQARVGCVPVPQAVEACASHMQQLESFLDVLVPPCDTSTYAGVVDFTERIKSQCGEVVCESSVFDSIVTAIKETQQVEQAETLWRFLLEVITLLTDELIAPKISSALSATVKNSRVLGRICLALSGYPPTNHKIQLAAASSLLRLARCPITRDALIEIIRSFPEAWSYFLPPTYCDLIGVETETTEALCLLIAAGGLTVTQDVFNKGEFFKTGIESSATAEGVMEVAKCLIFDESSHVGEAYFSFHRFILGVVASQLQLEALPPQKATHLVQYISSLLSHHCGTFALQTVEQKIFGALQRLSSQRRGSGILRGVCHAPKEALVKFLRL